MELPRLGPQRIKRLFQRRTPRPPTESQRGQAVVRQHDQLPALVAADMLGHHLTLVQHAEFVTAGANRDGPARQLRRCRVAIAVELDPGMRSDDRRSRPRRCRRGSPATDAAAGARAESGRSAALGSSRASARWPPGRATRAPKPGSPRSEVSSSRTSRQGVVLHVAHASLDDPFGFRVAAFAGDRLQAVGSRTVPGTRDGNRRCGPSR